MAKSRDAFRTISEVSTLLDIPAHVLRFWESKFSQIKPVKRAGGRRYYRPDDIALLGGIKVLLHDQGMTIKGAQKLIREKSVKHVMAIGEDIVIPDADEAEIIDMPATADARVAPEPVAPVVPVPAPSAARPIGTIAALMVANPAHLRAKAAQIAPLLRRLEGLRDTMRRA